MDQALVDQTVPIIMGHLRSFKSSGVGEWEAGKIRRWLLELEEPTHMTRSNWFTYEFQPTHIVTHTVIRFWDGQELDLTPPPEMW